MIALDHGVGYTGRVATTKAIHDLPKSRTPAEQAWDLVRAVIHGGEIVERFGLLAKEMGLSPGTMKALQRLDQGQFLSMRDVARGLGCDPSYVTGLVDELAEHGLVERRSHPEDRRVKTVVLTPEGVRAAEHIEAILGVPPSSFEALSDADARQLARLLAKVTTASAIPLPDS
jgi:DNA-binding MarR family transcriptional regulator